MKKFLEIYASGKAAFGNKKYRCVIGKNGVAENKIEGDGKTPLGCFEIKKVLFRRDRVKKPQTKLLIEEINRNDAWCIDVNSKNYNRQIKIPSDFRFEKLWRKDNIYDILIVLGYNDKPVRVGKGSAIFVHLARRDYRKTDGCIAFKKRDLLEILKDCDKDTLLCVRK